MLVREAHIESNSFDASRADLNKSASSLSGKSMLIAEIAICLCALSQRKINAEPCLLCDKSQSDLAESLSAFMGTAVSAMQACDQNIAGHQGRVAKIACAIGHEMEWEEGHIQALQVASTFHDVGKVVVSQEILTKPGRLTAGEFAQVKLHPEAGYVLLKGIPFPWPIAEAVRQHHERMDGSGYPRGLKGDEILPIARVLMIADVLDAMTSDRSYRPALKLEVVLLELEAQAGMLLDAAMVEQCVAMFREKRCELPC